MSRAVPDAAGWCSVSMHVRGPSAAVLSAGSSDVGRRQRGTAPRCSKKGVGRAWPAQSEEWQPRCYSAGCGVVTLSSLWSNKWRVSLTASAAANLLLLTSLEEEEEEYLSARPESIDGSPRYDTRRLTDRPTAQSPVLINARVFSNFVLLSKRGRGGQLQRN
jgi:hypothetical protein